MRGSEFSELVSDIYAMVADVSLWGNVLGCIAGELGGEKGNAYSAGRHGDDGGLWAVPDIDQASISAYQEYCGQFAPWRNIAQALLNGSVRTGQEVLPRDKFSGDFAITCHDGPGPSSIAFCRKPVAAARVTRGSPRTGMTGSRHFCQKGRAATRAGRSDPLKYQSP